MPRFRFHLYNAVHTADEEGREFVDFPAARLEAISNARALMAADICSIGVLDLSHRIELEDDAGELLVVNFRDAVTIKH